MTSLSCRQKSYPWLTWIPVCAGTTGGTRPHRLIVNFSIRSPGRFGGARRVREVERVKRSATRHPAALLAGYASLTRPTGLGGNP